MKKHSKILYKILYMMLAVAISIISTACDSKSKNEIPTNGKAYHVRGRVDGRHYSFYPSGDGNNGRPMYWYVNRRGRYSLYPGFYVDFRVWFPLEGDGRITIKCMAALEGFPQFGKKYEAELLPVGNADAIVWPIDQQRDIVGLEVFYHTKLCNVADTTTIDPRYRKWSAEFNSCRLTNCTIQFEDFKTSEFSDVDDIKKNIECVIDGEIEFMTSIDTDIRPVVKFSGLRVTVYNMQGMSLSTDRYFLYRDGPSPMIQ